MKISPNIKEIYDVEIPTFINRLNSLSRDERFNLYKEQTNKLFPKSKNIINLECLLSPRKDYQEKFKKAFLYVSNRMLSTYHLGEYCQDYFAEQTETSYVFPQKVVMCLSLLGYVEGIRSNYSYTPNKKSHSHGYIYYINTDKLDEGYWSVNTTEVNESEYTNESISNALCEYQSPEYQEWCVNQQFETFMAIKVSDDLREKKELHDEYVRRYIRNKKYLEDVDDFTDGCDSDDYNSLWIDSYELDEESEEEFTDMNSYRKEKKTNYELFQEYRNKAIKITELLEKDIDTIGHFNIDSYSGRFHSFMTRMLNDIRHSRELTIDGETLYEVDLSNSQPTLFGLLVKDEHPDLESEWVKHCLDGSFYEWLIDITNIDEVLNTPEIMYDSKIDDPHIYLRPTVKGYIMKILFSGFSMKSLEKNTGSPYKIFTSRLCKYLKTEEPLLYEKLKWYHSRENQCLEENKYKSLLPKHLQQMEVKYIKECLKGISPAVPYLYTVHDCIGCCEKDVETVKNIMETTSLKMFGVTLNLKIE